MLSNCTNRLTVVFSILYRERARLPLNIFPRELHNYSSKDSPRKAFIDIYENVYMHIHECIQIDTKIHSDNILLLEQHNFSKPKNINIFLKTIQQLEYKLHNNWNRLHCILIEGDIRHSFCWILPLSKSEARNARKETQNWLWHAYPWETENLHVIFELAEMSLQEKAVPTYQRLYNHK